MAANILGPSIRTMRKNRGWTQKQLSEKTGIAQNTISNHENQNRTLDEADIKRYSEAFGVSPQALYDLANQGDGIDIVAKLQATVIALEPQRQQNVYEYASDQLKEQRKGTDSVQNNVKQLPRADAAKSTKPDPFMPIAAHVEDDLTDEQQARVNAFMEKIRKEHEDQE